VFAVRRDVPFLCHPVYCIVYIAVFGTLTVTVHFQLSRTTRKIASSPGGDPGPNLIRGSLGLPESTTQTASQSVHLVTNRQDTQTPDCTTSVARGRIVALCACDTA